MPLGPLIGVFFHWLGGLASGSFYVPYRGVRRWSWETAWLVGGVFSWLIAPWFFGLLLTNDLTTVLSEAFSRQGSSVFYTFLFGGLWGLGGLTFGMSIRYLGMSLGMAIALGFCSVFGTLIPPLYDHTFHAKLIATASGNWILGGIILCVVGIMIAGIAGVLKEHQDSVERKHDAIKEFNFWKGLGVATFSGIMSACFSFGLRAGEPITTLSVSGHNTAHHWGGLPILVILLCGGFASNAVWCMILNLVNRSGGEYFSAATTRASTGGYLNDQPISGSTQTLPAGSPVPLLRNYLFSALAGLTWYLQFFFYTIGESNMGEYRFSSWTLHMASIIIFSSLWGIYFKEWRGASIRSFSLLVLALFVLVLSTVVIGFGNYMGERHERGNRHANAAWTPRPDAGGSATVATNPAMQRDLGCRWDAARRLMVIPMTSSEDFAMNASLPTGHVPALPRSMLLVVGMLCLCTALAAEDQGASSRHWSHAGPASPHVSITALRCEYLADPLGIAVLHPRLDWQVTGSANAPRNLRQRSYHILVASTAALLVGNRGDLWDSGVVTSDQTSHVPYAGLDLISREICFWKVQIVDSLGQQSAWSAMASWEMGLLASTDWQAKWIEAPFTFATEGLSGPMTIQRATYAAADGAGAHDVTSTLAACMKDNHLAITVSNDLLGGDPAVGHAKILHVTYAINGRTYEANAAENTALGIPEGHESLSYLRRDFTLTKPLAKARLYATALGLYEFDINGHRVGDHVFAPDWTDYAKRVRYQVYDVTPLLKPDQNTLASMVGKGWFCGHIGNGGFQSWGKVPALLGQLELTYQDGSVERIITDGDWKIHACPITASDFMLGESYDARQEISGWAAPGLDLHDWTPARVRDESSRVLDAQIDQPVRQIMERHPRTMSVPRPGHWTYDLGQNMVGFVRLAVTEPAGTRITIRHAEMLNADGTIYTANLRGAPSIDTYICKGIGVEVWQPRFTFHGFRYVELTGLPEPPTLTTITGIVIGTDIPRTGSFTCSDPDINQLQSNIQWGMRGNYLSVPTDCPQRDERMGWMGDAEVFVRTAAYNGDIAAFFTKWLVDVDDAQYPDGQFTDVSPSPAGSGHGNGGVPAWADAGVICPWTIYLMYGDRRILEQHLPAMKKWVDWCQVHSTNDIRDHDRGPDYGDWLAQGEDTPKDLIGTAYFAYSTSLVAKACQVIGDVDGAHAYAERFERIKQAFVQRYVTTDGHIQGGTQSGYCMALRFNLLPEELRAKAVQYLQEDVQAHQNHLTTGFIGVSYLLPVLTAGGKTGSAYALFLQNTFPSWLFSVKHGATTIWERWDGWTPERGFQDPGMNSFNHYSLGSCGEWMFDAVAGIGVDPEHAGFSHIIIHPHPSTSLPQAGGSFASIHGTIASTWSLHAGLFTLHLVIPVNTTATVILPTPTSASIREAGSPIGDHPEITTQANGHLLVGSGDYTFTCSAP